MKNLRGSLFLPIRHSRSLLVTILLIAGTLGALPGVAEEPAAKAVSEDAVSEDEIAALEEQVRETEIAFAASFAAGDMKAFSGFLHQDAVFMGGSTPLRGREAILERWTRMRGEGEPTFSWRPERVAVQGDGQLALSTGPVLAPDGTWFSSFVSTWKKTAEGWRIVLDVGPRCPPPKAPPEEPSQP